MDRWPWYSVSIFDTSILQQQADTEYSAAGLLFIVLLIRFLAELPGNHSSPAVKGKEFVDILITAVTVIVVAIPG